MSRSIGNKVVQSTNRGTTIIQKLWPFASFSGFIIFEKYGGSDMPLSIDPKFNDPLQRLILISPPAGELAIDLVSSIDPKPVHDQKDLTAAIIDTGLELAEKKSEAVDYFVKMLLELERTHALPHDKAQYFTNRIMALASERP
jgi:hypothetical protein